ncbi:peptidoglycan-binding domain-containing protein [Streptomyces sp. enrichment culture]|uniref:peptidoglycan-binding domain-containing protein n=1 Tax=Streptomyces sp. enrichment culture TaxID=1795815 RepID=UPI003F55D9C4
MRALTRALVSVATTAGIAVGSLAAAGTATAAPEPARQRAASAQAVSAVNNLGLTRAQAREWQRLLLKYGFNPGKVDGLLGTQSWKASQGYLNHRGFRAGKEDGILGPDTIRALQRYLNDSGGYRLVVDGIAGPRTKAAFRDHLCGC